MLVHRFRLSLAIATFMPLSALAQDPAATAPLPAARALPAPTGTHFPPAPAASSPGRVTALYTNLAASPTSDVPGIPGAKFMASTSSTTIFNRPWLSPNGTHWAITAYTNLPTTEDQVLLVDGTVLVREGTTFPPDPTQTWGPLDLRVGINDAGEIAVTTNVAPSTVNDDYTVKITAGPTYSVFSQQGGAIGALPGAFFGNNADSPVLLNDGRISVSDDLITGSVTTADDEIIVLDNTLIAREGITIPGNQPGAATYAWENFDIEETWISTGGTHTLILGDLLAPVASDQMLVYDGNVVLQEGIVITGSSFTSPIGTTGITYASMDSAGGWIAHGHNVDGVDWVVHNGTVVNQTDAPLGSVGEKVVMTVTLDGAQETPPNGSPATGTGTILVDTSANIFYYEIAITGLTGMETAAHLHGFAAPGTPAGILHSLPVTMPMVGSISYLESEEQGILSGQTYLDVHSTQFSGGEIRGQVVPVPETWFNATPASETFFAVATNQLGDFVIMGRSNAPFQVNGVLVLNNAHVIGREGDPIDLDGNGLYDDDTFITTFGNENIVIADDGTVYFTASMRNAAGLPLGQGFFRRNGGNLQRTFCFGDGAGTACPCGNRSPAGAMAGCASSLGVGGRLDTSGTASIAADTLALIGSQMPNSSVLYFQGTTQVAGGLGAAFGDGLRCAAGSVVRLKTLTNVGGGSQYPNAGSPSVSVRGSVTVPGTRNYQAWYRNAALFCTPSTFNLTNAVEIVWGN